MLGVFARSLPTWALIVGALVAVVGASVVVLSLRSGKRAVAGWTVFLSVLVGILLITVTPSGSYADSGSCALHDWRPIQPSRLFTLNHDALNVWVFFALGLATTALPGRGFSIGFGLVCLTPPAIELTQYLLPALGRACQSGDLVNNWTGAVVGLLIAGGVRALRRTS